MRTDPLKGDNTLYRDRINRYSEFVKEYESIKKNQHPEFNYVQDWCMARKICKKNFLKYYGRYRQSGRSWDLAPQKRGPRYKTRRPCQALEQKVIDLRKLGNNRYEIAAILKNETGSNFNAVSVGGI